MVKENTIYISIYVVYIPYICIYIHIYTSEKIYIRTYKYIYVYIYTYIYILLRKYIYVHISIYIYTYIYTSKYIYIYIYIYIYTYIYIYFLRSLVHGHGGSECVGNEHDPPHLLILYDLCYALMALFREDIDYHSKSRQIHH